MSDENPECLFSFLHISSLWPYVPCLSSLATALWWLPGHNLVFSSELLICPLTLHFFYKCSVSPLLSLFLQVIDVLNCLPFFLFSFNVSCWFLIFYSFFYLVSVLIWVFCISCLPTAQTLYFFLVLLLLPFIINYECNEFSFFYI